MTVVDRVITRVVIELTEVCPSQELLVFRTQKATSRTEDQSLPKENSTVCTLIHKEAKHFSPSTKCSFVLEIATN